jgi:hypothetical protein
MSAIGSDAGMKDYKLASLINPGPLSGLVKLETSPSSTGDILEQFRFNIHRVDLAIVMPLHVEITSMLVQLSIDKAKSAIVGNLDLTTTPEDHVSVIAEANRRIPQELSILQNESVHHQLLTESVARLEPRLAGYKPTDFIQPWLQSIVVMTWTAFEVMATDLWVEAVNLRPTLLGQTAWEWVQGPSNKGKAEKAELGEGNSDAKSKKGFGLDLMAQYGFNLSTVRLK